MSTSVQAVRESLGLPPRPAPSAMLWSQILGKEPNSSHKASQPDPALPPLTPIDKNATSMRILLHDTQANFEKFSLHVDKLLNNFSETKSEITLVKTLFERDRETLTNDMIDLVNRCQTQIQKTVGAPAQSPVLDQLSKDVSQRLENLDKRLDALQTLSQTHAQSLQTHIQAVQSIQEQQCTILAVITPLLPLIQAIPLHIDSAKNALSDLFRKQTPCYAKANQATQTSPKTQPLSTRSPSKRQRTVSLSENLATLASSHANKKPRVEGHTLKRLSVTSVGLDTRKVVTPTRSAKRQHVQAALHAEDRALLDCPQTSTHELGPNTNATHDRISRTSYIRNVAKSDAPIGGRPSSSLGQPHIPNHLSSIQADTSALSRIPTQDFGDKAAPKKLTVSMMTPWKAKGKPNTTPNGAAIWTSLQPRAGYVSGSQVTFRLDPIPRLRHKTNFIRPMLVSLGPWSLQKRAYHSAGYDALRLCVFTATSVHSTDPVKERKQKIYSLTGF
ncbi:hypothetical protein AX17_007236 [Amanita inopinata Kibby_2008]|nr:hypothetical protein AX17_007236 [Amanita inopinata Kibby_2008]